MPPDIDIKPRQSSPLFAIPALIALGLVAALALFPDPKLLGPAEIGPDKITLLFLVVCFLFALIPAFSRHLIENRDAATWAVLVAGVILFHIAYRAGPRAGEGFGIQWSLTPDEPLAIPYALRIVVFGALLSAGAWAASGGPARAFVAGLLGLGLTGAMIFTILGRYYAVGVTEILDPTPLGTLMVQIVAYACLALCARAATATEATRSVLFKILPLILLGVWARHQFAPIAAPVEAE